jgi:hypothetical protein
MKILNIFLITIILWCVIAKEQNKSNISSEKVVKTEEKTEVKKTEVKTTKTSEKVVKNEKNPSDISDPNITNLFPVTTVKVNVKSLSAHEVHIN